MNVIEVNNLSKKYKDILAVDDITFSVEKGSIFGMIGPNGAGKTTTIECTIGIKKRDQGMISVLGFDPLEKSIDLYKKIGVQLQETSYQDKIKVHEICSLFMSMYSEPLDYVPLLERFNLSNKNKSFLSNLSGGQRQKIAIILALIANPEIIFLDELTSGLDPKARREMWTYIKELKNEGRTIFMTTHYMEEAEFLCDTICIIDEGKLIATGDLQSVINKADIDTIITFNTKEDIVTAIKNNITGISKLEITENKISIYSKNADLISELILFLEKNGISYNNVNIIRPTLEDAYLKMTGKSWKE
ncbi:MAG: ABC transporter ATP-binding protein [Clostridiales bacterium]|nr:ABC transporter ATP-binding protein [Clostridiales bacterium]